MMKERPDSEFRGHADENRRIWDANAHWWDDRIGDGNDFQTLLIEPATERLLAVSSEDVILDIACGAGRFARRMAELGASVVAFDHSANFIERARARTPRRSSPTVVWRWLGRPTCLDVDCCRTTRWRLFWRDPSRLKWQRRWTVYALSGMWHGCASSDGGCCREARSRDR